MALPASLPAGPISFAESMDPGEKVEFILNLTGTEKAILAPGESVASFEFELWPSAVAMGLYISVEAGREMALINSATAILLWPMIDPDFQDDPAWLNGATLPAELRIVTNNDPPRWRERTVVLTVKQK